MPSGNEITWAVGRCRSSLAGRNTRNDCSRSAKSHLIADVPYITEVGYTFPTFEITITPEAQRRLHSHCDIPESHYGDLADPAFIARDPIILSAQTVLANHPERAPVHTAHRIEQRRQIRLGETL